MCPKYHFLGKILTLFVSLPLLKSLQDHGQQPLEQPLIAAHCPLLSSSLSGSCVPGFLQSDVTEVFSHKSVGNLQGSLN